MRLVLALIFTISLLFASLPSTLTAQSGTGLNAEKLKMITDFAESNCPTPATTGTQNTVSGSAEFQLDLSNLLKKLASLGTAIKGDVAHTTFQNVPQTDLVVSRQDSMKCKQNLIALVVDRVEPTPSAETDSIQVVEAAITRRGPNNQNLNPLQYYVHGVANVEYTGKGPYKTDFFTVCLTNSDKFDKGSSTCSSNSSFGPTLNSKVELGLHAYPFEVFLSDSLPSGQSGVPIMVCILDGRNPSYFMVSREERYNRLTPVCSVVSVKP